MQIDGATPSGGYCLNVAGSMQQFFNIDSNCLLSWGVGTNPATNAYFSFTRLPVATPPALVTKNFKVIDAADTARTASTEFINFHANANIIRTWATGALALQRDHLFSGGAVAFVGASTCTQAATLGIDLAPTAGTNCTLTDAYGILTATGVRCGFGGALVGNLSALVLGTLAFSWAATGDANATLTASQCGNPIILLTGATLTATRNLIVVNPSAAGGIYIVKNGTGGAQSVQIIGTSGTGITIATGKTAVVCWDGTNFIRITADV